MEPRYRVVKDPEYRLIGYWIMHGSRAVSWAFTSWGAHRRLDRIVGLR